MGGIGSDRAGDDGFDAVVGLLLLVLVSARDNPP